MNGQGEIVKKYKFQRINGLRMEGHNEIEVNEFLKTALIQMFGDRFNKDEGERIINEVVLPALITIEI